MTLPHWGQVTVRDALIFSKSIFPRGIAGPILVPGRKKTEGSFVLDVRC